MSKRPSGLRVHPMDLSMYGMTPDGRPLFRIVWADSRTVKLEYEGVIHELQHYAEAPLTHGKWVVEKWLSAEKYIGMNRDLWEEMYRGPLFGQPREPWPERGEYELSHIFQSGVDMEGVRQAIEKTEHDLRNMSPAELKKFAEERAEKKQAAKKEQKQEAIHEIFDTPKEKVGVLYGYSNSDAGHANRQESSAPRP